MSGQQGGEAGLEEVADRVLLDVKALVLLCGSEEKLRRVVRERLLQAGDREVEEFVGIVREESLRRTSPLRVLGEIVLSVLLAVAGVVLLAPAAIGQLVPPADYFGAQGGPLGLALAHLYGPLLVVLGLLLLGGSLATLRDAAESLRKS